MFLPEPVRAWLYRILVAVGGLLVLYGVLGESELNGWLLLAGSILTIESGLASANTSIKEPDYSDEEWLGDEAEYFLEDEIDSEEG